MRYVFRLILSPLARIVSPGYSFCLRCRLTWNFVEKHSTFYITKKNIPRGMFPLCKCCWKELSIEERLPYYKKLSDRHKNDSEEWEYIKIEVLHGN